VSRIRKTAVQIFVGFAVAGFGLVAPLLWTAPAHASSTAGGTITRSEVLQRAQSWVDAQVPYSQSTCYPSGTYTSDASCSIPDYREDCSGFVSMAWHLTASLNTGGLPSVSTKLGSFSQLQPGDILDYTAEHTILFVGWTNQANGDFNFDSESTEGVPTGEHSANIYAAQIAGHPSSAYGAYQYNHIVDDPTPPAVEVFGGKLVDFTGDGKPDVVGRLNDSLYVWPNATSGQPSLAGAVNLGGGWATMNSLITADFNGDGKPDIIARQGDHLYFWLNTSTPGSPSLGGPNDLGYGWSSIDSIMAANLNGDAKIDIIGRLGDHLYVWTGYGTGINAPVDLGYGWQTINSLMSTDFNSDGRADIIGRLGDHLYVWTSNGTGLNNPADLGQGWTSITSLTTADFTNDGHPDIIGRLGDNLYVWAGNGTGLGSPANFGSGWGSISPLMTGDFTGDGKTDVVSRLSDNLYTWAGNGTGLGSPTNLGNGWGTIALITKS